MPLNLKRKKNLRSGGQKCMRLSLCDPIHLKVVYHMTLPLGVK